VKMLQFRRFDFLLVIALVAGCSSPKETISIDHSSTSQEIIAMVNSLPSSIQTFTAAGSIDVQTPQMAQSAGFDIALKKPDSVRLVIEGPFGITVGKALLTHDTFKLYNALSNTLYEGDTRKGLEMLPNTMDFNPELLIDAMSGVRRFEEKYSTPDSFYVSQNSYVFVFVNDTVKVIFTVSGESHRITKVQTFSEDSVILLEEKYSYTQTQDSIWKPSLAHISIPAKSIILDVYFDDVSINPGIETLTLTFPDDAQRIIIN
jgi:hypothetical protein